MMTNKMKTVLTICILLILLIVFFVMIATTTSSTSSSSSRSPNNGNLRSSSSNSNSNSNSSSSNTNDYLFQSKGEILWNDEFYENELVTKFWSNNNNNNNNQIESSTTTNNNNNNDGLYYYYRNSTVLVNDGYLTISATKQKKKEEEENGDDTTTMVVHSGSIYTKDKVLFQYGTLEAKIKVTGPLIGLSPTFYIQSVSSKIDILKTTPGRPITSNNSNYNNNQQQATTTTTTTTTNYSIRGISSAQWWENGDKNNKHDPVVLESIGNDYDFNDNNNNSNSNNNNLQDGEYHTYKLDWTPKSITTYRDGVIVWEMDISKGSSCPYCDESFHQPHYVGLSLTVLFITNNDDNNDDYSPYGNSTMIVDYVRLFNNGFSIADVL